MNTSNAFRLSVIVIIISLVASTPSAFQNSNEILQDSVVSVSGVEYQVTFFQANFSVLIEIKNTEDRKVTTSYTLEVDNRRHHGEIMNISSGEESQRKFYILDSIGILRYRHTINFSTFGASTQFNFTKDIPYRNSTRFPKPQITDVTVANGTVDGERSTVAYVTVNNPTNQLYSMKLLVHTEETQGGLYGASTSAYTNTTAKVELLEEPGSVVAGEARLYVGEPSEREGGLDQVEFVGRAAGETNVYNQSYEAVRGPWAEESYVYRNASVGGGDGWLEDSPSSPALQGVVGVGLVVLVVFVVRRLV